MPGSREKSVREASSLHLEVIFVIMWRDRVIKQLGFLIKCKPEFTVRCQTKD
jgi:hypothetical protein